MALHHSDASVADKCADLVSRNMRVRTLSLAPIAHVAQEERQHVESVSSAGANPAVGTNLNPGISLKGERLSYKEEAAERYRHPRPVY